MKSLLGCDTFSSIFVIFLSLIVLEKFTFLEMGIQSYLNAIIYFGP
jgi:hypothetical protein